MRDCCHGISSADLLYNRFSDDASCCPATCSVSRAPCRCVQIRGSFTSSQHFKNKHIPINQSKAPRASSEAEKWLPAWLKLHTHTRIRCKCSSTCLSIQPQHHPVSTCDSDEVPWPDFFASFVKNEAISCRKRVSVPGSRGSGAREGLDSRTFWP